MTRSFRAATVLLVRCQLLLGIGAYITLPQSRNLVGAKTPSSTANLTSCHRSHVEGPEPLSVASFTSTKTICLFRDGTSEFIYQVGCYAAGVSGQSCCSFFENIADNCMSCVLG